MKLNKMLLEHEQISKFQNPALLAKTEACIKCIHRDRFQIALLILIGFKRIN